MLNLKRQEIRCALKQVSHDRISAGQLACQMQSEAFVIKDRRLGQLPVDRIRDVLDIVDCCYT